MSYGDYNLSTGFDANGSTAYISGVAAAQIRALGEQLNIESQKHAQKYQRALNREIPRTRSGKESVRKQKLIKGKLKDLKKASSAQDRQRITGEIDELEKSIAQNQQSARNEALKSRRIRHFANAVNARNQAVFLAKNSLDHLDSAEGASFEELIRATDRAAQTGLDDDIASELEAKFATARTTGQALSAQKQY